MRRNLPERVRAGAAYRDVHVVYTLATASTGGAGDVTERRTLGDPAQGGDGAARAEGAAAESGRARRAAGHATARNDRDDERENGRE
ncbi:hypothetical protein ABZ654_32705 [Streptomyces hygroscopicus]|uniref:hypothetical protein n=1 Tax=Streptomyces hygroscopicus TaxID=1912 RepID=UPI00340FE479